MSVPVQPESWSRRDLLTLASPRDTSADHWVRASRTAMACRFEVLLSGEHAAFLGAAQAALEAADRVEDCLTVFRDSSEVSRVNARAGQEAVPVSDDLFTLLATAARLHARTGGAFDPTATPLSKAWGFLRRAGRLPQEAEIEEARARTGMAHVLRRGEGRTVRFERPGLELSFGSIGKGYALDVMATALRGHGVPSALLSAGGSSVLAFGGGRDGFTVDVTSPRLPGPPLFRLRLRDAAQATSGAGEQFFEVEGRRFGHVIDPRTGWPAKGVTSATVITRSAAEADALSTAFLVAGAELAENYCRENPDTLALLVPEDEPKRRLVFGHCEGAQLEAP